MIKAKEVTLHLTGGGKTSVVVRNSQVARIRRKLADCLYDPSGKPRSPVGLHLAVYGEDDRLLLKIPAENLTPVITVRNFRV